MLRLLTLAAVCISFAGCGGDDAGKNASAPGGGDEPTRVAMEAQKSAPPNLKPGEKPNSGTSGGSSGTAYND